MSNVSHSDASVHSVGSASSDKNSVLGAELLSDPNWQQVLRQAMAEDVMNDGGNATNVSDARMLNRINGVKNQAEESHEPHRHVGHGARV